MNVFEFLIASVCDADSRNKDLVPLLTDGLTLEHVMGWSQEAAAATEDVEGVAV